jgi:hypothetical protein
MATESITILAKNYFDKRYGNTYFSAEVIVNNEPAFTLPAQYGYGDQYLFEACQQLKARGYLNTEDNKAFSNCLSYLCRENNIKLIYNVSEVRKMKEL